MSEDKQRIFRNIGQGTMDFKTKMITWVKEKMKKGGMFTLFLVAINGIYLLFGGLVFMGFERIPPVKYNPSTQLTTLFQVFKDTQLGHKLLPKGLSARQIVGNMTSQDLKLMTSTLDYMNEERAAAGAEEWTIYNSVFFASTVVTTIGYGSLAPSTAGGRVFCVIYALLGIPLTLMLLALVGRYLAEHINNVCSLALKWFTHYVHPEYQYKPPDQDGQGDEQKIDAPIWLALLFLIVFTSIMAGVYTQMEGWDFGTALYFLFISYTTIGFGDVVPHDEVLVSLDIILLYIGLAVVSITINLCMVNIQHQMMKAKFIEEMQENDTEMNEQETAKTAQGDNPFKNTSDTEETAVKEQLSSEEKRTYGTTSN